jgi:GT2 family glycosyltransferase
VLAVETTIDDPRTEIIVQDDASPLHDMSKMVRNCERNVRNLGFPGNCNAGAARASGDALLFLNQDCFARGAGWDTRLLEFFDGEPQAGIAGPTLLFPDGKIQSVGGQFDAACHPYHVALGYSNPDYEPIATPRIVPWITGAAFAVRRTLWDQLNGFDTIYAGGYFEDVDFSIRAKLAGFDTWHRPNIRFTHEVGNTGGNPRFMDNALEFKRRYVDTKIIEKDIDHLAERWWA